MIFYPKAPIYPVNPTFAEGCQNHHKIDLHVSTTVLYYHPNSPLQSYCKLNEKATRKMIQYKQKTFISRSHKSSCHVVIMFSEIVIHYIVVIIFSHNSNIYNLTLIRSYYISKNSITLCTYCSYCILKNNSIQINFVL